MPTAARKKSSDTNPHANDAPRVANDHTMTPTPMMIFRFQRSAVQPSGTVVSACTAKNAPDSAPICPSVAEVRAQPVVQAGR